jgi:hypothetical protein
MARIELGGRYRLNRRVLRGDHTRGVPDLWAAEDAGDLYYVKLWKRQGEDRADIRALWNREVRGLTRLQGYPGAEDLFVRLQDLRADERQYYAVLDSGRRTLLSEILRERGRYQWLQNLSEVGRRRALWDGMLRVAQALALLHAEGTLHRSIAPTSIFVSLDGQGDFRLSGFEWSLRIAAGAAAERVGRPSSLVPPELDKADGEYSTATDWFDLGLVAAELFGIPVRTMKKRAVVRQAVESLSVFRDRERALVRSLLLENQEERLASAGEIIQEIQGIVRDLTGTSAALNRNLVLAARLGPGSNLSRAIATASGGRALADSPLVQRNWMEQDLRGDLRVTARKSGHYVYVVRGETLEYRVRQWQLEGGAGTWDIGFCDAAEIIPRTLPDDQHFSLGHRTLEVMTLPDAKKVTPRLRDRSAPWDKVFSVIRPRSAIEPHLRGVHDFFRVTQMLDTALIAATVCPVRVIDKETSETATTVEVTPIEHEERNRLAQFLGLASPSQQLRDRFDLGIEPVFGDDDDEPKSDTYQLLDRPTLDGEAPTVRWRFVSANADPRGFRYRFRYGGVTSVREGVLYLARNHGGTLAQLRRRHRAIEEMRFHGGLLRLLADPMAATRINGDELPSGRAELPFDSSKRRALERLWHTQPFFAVQGLPGTGKTMLVKAFTDRLLTDDPSAQVLVTAHSHHTVDDVMGKIADLFGDLPPEERPIVLRLDPRDETSYNVEPVTDDLVARLAGSELAASSPEFLRTRLEALRSDGSSPSEAAEVDHSTMRLLVQDAANLTFSTLNSGDLAELSRRDRRFDWSIIEEAGKAHGFDMAVALEASHRLLLIGDHFQLPPFNAEIFQRLLGDPLTVSKVIQAAWKFAPSLIDPSVVEADEDGQEPMAERCDQWRRMVGLFAWLFNASGWSGAGLDAPTATLTKQHRMHPHIAELVGKVFYPDGRGGTILKSPDETHERFAGHPPFMTKPGSWLPQERVVWCDVPWKQRREESIGEEDDMFVAYGEVRAVTDVLVELQPVPGSRCEVQILSPYNDQLEAIRKAIRRSRGDSRLEAMFSPPFDLTVGKRMGATVDDFQGSEADVVIVSLVRNNPHPRWRSVGFLSAANRMNVLLSRARHKLIIVGSWDFFASRCDHETPPDAPYAYIGRLMDEASRARADGRLARVDALQ